MHVHFAPVECMLVDSKPGCVALHIGQRNPRRFLHHVAELSGQNQPARARHRRRLHEQYVTADARDREPRRHTRHRGPDRRLMEDLGTTERIAHGRLVDQDRARLVG